MNESLRCQACGQFHESRPDGLCPLKQEARSEEAGKTEGQTGPLAGRHV